MKEGLMQKIADYLEDWCGDSAERIMTEVNSFGDTEVDSIFFLEIIGPLEDELGVTVKVKDIHNKVKSSFKDFCELISELLIARGDDLN
ncbi:acyl carrier protein [Virgibacillus halodenitrificans]|uniref:acyl carrier protein n=1 Tax=Virgibacillus halodenitrificans TaxID=1482 RepID=UPI0024C0BC08|nr:acyl carrier protein [Virgibacillus halodenitrificans]WHX25111.1 acyl carrier protein [Virgibacillus halodenitrificans]